MEQSKGRSIMSPEHWELRNPVGYLKKLIADANRIVDEYNQLAKQLGYEETEWWKNQSCSCSAFSNIGPKLVRIAWDEGEIDDQVALVSWRLLALTKIAD